MKDPINARVQQTQRYWYVDGLGELATGLILLLYGLSFLVAERFNEGPGAVVIGLGQPLLFVVGALMTGKVVRVLKERITYPRTGYVSYPKKRTPSRMARSFIIGASVAFGMAYVTIAMENARSVLPIITGGLGALSILFLAYRLGLTRFYIMAVFTAMLGVLTAWLPLDMLAEYAFFFSIFGLFWMISGAVTLIRYLRETQPAGESL